MARPAKSSSTPRKTGGDVETIAKDAAVVMSLALQHGAAVETIRHAITRNSNGMPSSILGAIVDALPATGRGAA